MYGIWGVSTFSSNYVASQKSFREEYYTQLCRHFISTATELCNVASILSPQTSSICSPPSRNFGTFITLFYLHLSVAAVNKLIYAPP